MTVEHQDEIVDLRARLAGLRMLLHARRLRMEAGDAATQSPEEELVQPVMVAIAAVKARLETLGVAVP